MSILDALILGILQGLTEFLPISSSGHLVLAQHFLGVDQTALDEAIMFILILHLGTVVAVVFCYWDDIVGLFKSLRKGNTSDESTPTDLPNPDSPVSGFSSKDVSGSIPKKIFLMFLISIVATAIFGIPIDKFFEEAFKNPQWAAVGLIVTAIILALSLLANGRGGISTIKPRSAFLVGLGQGFAVFPGISRSGTTIVIGMMLGLSGKEAARYTFLLSVPTIILASAMKFLDFLDEGTLSIPISCYVVGFIASAIFGVIAIKILIQILAKGKIAGFAIYCLVLGITTLILVG